jgi:uncharacterized protein
LTVAVQWYRKAADQAYPLALSNLGRMTYFGQGVPRDHSVAISLWEQAARKGDGSAEFMLGLAYEAGGEGTVQDLPLAASWYRKAADQGLSAAQNSLGKLYMNGNGVPRDLMQAHMWFNLAATRGDPQAARNRETVAGQMTAQQVEDAQKQARDWRPNDSRASVNSGPVDSDCADGQQLCKEGSFLCGVYKRDFVKHGRTCPGVTDRP